MLKKLEERLESTTPKHWKVGDIFLQMADFLKMYTVYVSNQDIAMQALTKIKENSSMIAWLRDIEKNPQLNGLTLRDFLVKPVQRICRYPLLIEQLIRYTRNSHVDYSQLTAALAKMEAIAKYVNEAKRHEENITKVVEIQQMLTGCENLVTPTRKYIREGDLTEVDGKKKTIRHFYLFNDLLLWTSTGSGSMKKNMIKKSMQFKGQTDLSICVLNTLQDTKDLKYAFQLTSLNLHSGKHVISANSQAEKDSWMEDILKVIEELMEIDSNKKRHSIGKEKSSLLDGIPKITRSSALMKKKILFVGRK